MCPRGPSGCARRRVLPAGNTITSVDVSLLAGPGTAAGLELGPALYAASTTDIAQLNVNASYGDPFDATWPVIAGGRINLRQPLSDPAGAASGWLLSEMILANGTYTFVAPPMVHTPTLDGIPLDGRTVGWDGVSPLRLDLHVAEPNAEQSVLIVDRTLPLVSTVFGLQSSDGASLIIPPELLHFGSTYELRLAVWDQRVPSTGSLVTAPPFMLVAK